MRDAHYSWQGMHVFQGCVTFALDTLGCIFLSTSSVGMFFLFSLWNLSQWMLRVKSAALNGIFSAGQGAESKHSSLACTNSQLLLFKLLREARVLVSAAWL